MGTRWKRGPAAGLAALGLLCLIGGPLWAKLSKSELQAELKDDGLVGDWNYDDIPGGLRRAAKEGKPVLVVFR